MASRVVHPRDVPGYAEAAGAGNIPRVGPQPPELSVTPSTRSMFHRLIAVTLGGAVGLGVLSLILKTAHVPSVVIPFVLGAGALAVFVAAKETLARMGDQSLAEFRNGYTTLVLSIGGFWLGEGPTNKSGDMRAAWDYSGLWYLNGSNGEVIRPPSLAVDGPGMYPSPHRAGCFELWTGVVWLGHFDCSMRR